MATTGVPGRSSARQTRAVPRVRITYVHARQRAASSFNRAFAFARKSSAEGLAKKPLERLSRRGVGRALLRLYTLLAVLLGFVMFRASDLAQGWLMLSRLFSFTPAGLAAQLVCRSVLTPGRIGALLLGAVFSLPVGPALRRMAEKALGEDSPALELAGDALALAGLALCVLAMSGGGFSPFIYQQF